MSHSPFPSPLSFFPVHARDSTLSVAVTAGHWGQNQSMAACVPRVGGASVSRPGPPASWCRAGWGEGWVFGWSPFRAAGLVPTHFPDKQLERTQEQSVPLLTVGAVGVSAPLCSWGSALSHPQQPRAEDPSPPSHVAGACMKLSQFRDGGTEACSCSRPFTGSLGSRGIRGAFGIFLSWALSSSAPE